MFIMNECKSITKHKTPDLVEYSDIKIDFNTKFILEIRCLSETKPKHNMFAVTLIFYKEKNGSSI